MPLGSSVPQSPLSKDAFSLSTQTPLPSPQLALSPPNISYNLFHSINAQPPILSQDSHPSPAFKMEDSGKINNNYYGQVYVRSRNKKPRPKPCQNLLTTNNQISTKLSSASSPNTAKPPISCSYQTLNLPHYPIAGPSSKDNLGTPVKFVRGNFSLPRPTLQESSDSDLDSLVSLSSFNSDPTTSETDDEHLEEPLSLDVLFNEEPQSPIKAGGSGLDMVSTPLPSHLPEDLARLVDLCSLKLRILSPLN